MNTLKLTYENGKETTTTINELITWKEIQQYFINQYFNLGIIEDDMQKCIHVEMVN